MNRQPSIVAAVAAAAIALGIALTVSRSHRTPNAVGALSSVATHAPERVAQSPAASAGRAEDLERPPFAEQRANERAEERAEPSAIVPAGPTPHSDVGPNPVVPAKSPGVERLTPEQQRRRLEKLRDDFRKARERGGYAEAFAASQCALHAIAVDLDSRGRGEDVLGRRISLRPRERLEQRFVTNGNLYVFRLDEFAGYADVAAVLRDTPVLADAAQAERHLPERSIAEIEALTDRAIEHLTR